MSRYVIITEDTKYYRTVYAVDAESADEAEDMVFADRGEILRSEFVYDSREIISINKES